MLRPETRARARALQLLYACELTGAGSVVAAGGLARLTGPEPRVLDGAEALAEAVLTDREALDRLIRGAADNWRMERIGVVERNILRIGIHELRRSETPPRVVIDEAIRLGKWFGGPKTPAFVNGVLDRIARSLGRL
ncbi:MAG TPA: transcription antitermination factor NusB [Gemmatimonadales bacterium]|nr:transcription antitermination factor NusB [Gemmatimonadales bacterium]